MSDWDGLRSIIDWLESNGQHDEDGVGKETCDSARSFIKMIEIAGGAPPTIWWHSDAIVFNFGEKEQPRNPLMVTLHGSSFHVHPQREVKMTDKPRSAGVFSAAHVTSFQGNDVFTQPFKPTHRNYHGQPVELLMRNLYTYPTAYPQVLLRDETGVIFVVSEETFDNVKKKVRVNYPEYTDAVS